MTFTLTSLAFVISYRGFPDGTVVKNPPPSAGDAGDMSLTAGWERSHGVGSGNSLQYSCMKIP